MAAKYIDWSKSPDTEKSGDFYKWKTGANRVRFVGAMFVYRHPWKNGAKTERKVCLIDTEDAAKGIQVASLKASVVDWLKTWIAENGVQPGSAEAPSFLVTRTGTGKDDTKYVCVSSKPFAIPAGIDVAKEEAKLEALCAKMEKGDDLPGERL